MCVHTLSHVSYNFIPSPVSCSQSNKLYTDVYWEKYELFFLFPINNILGFFYLINLTNTSKNRLHSVSDFPTRLNQNSKGNHKLI